MTVCLVNVLCKFSDFAAKAIETFDWDSDVITSSIALFTKEMEPVYKNEKLNIFAFFIDIKKNSYTVFKYVNRGFKLSMDI